MARNYTGAPRFCPGYHLSMKVAKEVCAQFTKVQWQWWCACRFVAGWLARWQDLNQWGGYQREHQKIEGLVKIKCLGEDNWNVLEDKLLPVLT